MHKVLERQLKKVFGTLEAVPKELQPLLKLVDDSYTHYDEDRALIERSLEISSRELMEQTSLLRAALNSITNGILVVDLQGKVIAYNTRLTEMWGVPDDVFSRNEDLRVDAVLEQVNNPDDFRLQVRELISRPDAESLDVINLKDGRVFERYSHPQYRRGEVVGRVWSFLDITERIRTEQERQKQIQELERMNKLMIDRELKMIDLKKEIATLKGKIGGADVSADKPATV